MIEYVINKIKDLLDKVKSMKDFLKDWGSMGKWCSSST